MLVGLPALLEAEALSVQLQDMDMVGEAVEKGPGKPFRAKDFGPLIEGQVGGSQDLVLRGSVFLIAPQSCPTDGGHLRCPWDTSSAVSRWARKTIRRIPPGCP